MQPQMDFSPTPPAPLRPKSKNNVALIVVLSSCGCAFLMIPILAAILFPVFAQARAKAREASCISNVKQMSLGVLMYAQDYDEVFPAPQAWMTNIDTYVKNPIIYQCPVARADGGASGAAYGYAYHALLDNAHVAEFPAPETTVLMYDSSTLTQNASDELESLPAPPRHAGVNVIAFLDGHVKALTPDGFASLIQSAPQVKTPVENMDAPGNEKTPAPKSAKPNTSKHTKKR